MLIFVHLVKEFAAFCWKPDLYYHIHQILSIRLYTEKHESSAQPYTDIPKCEGECPCSKITLFPSFQIL